MRTISQRKAVEWTDKINLGLWIKKNRPGYLWFWKDCLLFKSSSKVGDSLSSLCFTRLLSIIDQIYPFLSRNLLSRSRRLRLACLRLLDSKLIDPIHSQVEVVRRCLQGEEVSIEMLDV